MTEENNEVDIPEGYVASKMTVTSPDGGPVSEAKELVLTFTGPPVIVSGAAEILLSFLELVFGGEVVEAKDADGNPIELGPAMVDFLDAGDDTVA